MGRRNVASAPVAEQDDVRSAPSARRQIPLMRPLLVEHEAVLPYLRKIDESRWYSNFGPLVQQLEERMAGVFQTGSGTVVSTSNGTAALTNILRALDLPHGSLCLLPSWTFIATPASVVSAGLVPCFADVDEKTWALDPQTTKAQVAALAGQVSVVMTVAPYGAPQDVHAWDAFTEETGIPVIIDAAAAFDSFSSVRASRPGKNPVMISLHATKTFGIGEGGLVISTDKALVERVREMSNFGFSDARIVRLPGINGKMSEYSAAVALATLDNWPQIRERWLLHKRQYMAAFAKVTRLTGINPWFSDEWVASTFNVRLTKGTAESVIRRLLAEGIESRQWWGKGCHAHPAYAGHPRLAMPVTEALGESVLALPFTLDMEKSDVAYIVDTFLSICTGYA